MTRTSFEECRMKKTNLTICTMVMVLATTSTGLADLSDGLVAYYPFNGNTNDASGNGYDLTTVHGAVPTTGRFGNTDGAYLLDGIDDYIFGYSHELVVPSAQGSFAVSFWFTPTTTWTPTDNPNSLLVGDCISPNGQLD